MTFRFDWLDRPVDLPQGWPRPDPGKVESLAIRALWCASAPTIEVLSQSALPQVGAPSVTSGPAGPTLRTFSGSANGISLGNQGDILPADNCTILIYRRCIDTTARVSLAFGWPVNADNRVLAHAPYSDGNLYWDFGNATAGSGRISVAYAKDTELETLAFVAGASVGREVWRRGVRIAANSGATATKPAGTATDAFWLGCGGGTPTTNADDVEYYLMAVCHRVLSADEIGEFCAQPFHIFEPRVWRVWVPAPAAQAAARRRNLAPLLARHRLWRHAPYTPATWTPAELFATPGADNGVYFDFSDPTTMRKGDGTQAGAGDAVATIIPKAGNTGNWTSPSGPVAGPGYLDFPAGSTGRPSRNFNFSPASKGGFTVAVVAREPTISSGYQALVDAQYGLKECLRGPEFISTGAEFYSFLNDSTYCFCAGSYTRTVGNRVLLVAWINSTTAKLFRDSATPLATVASNNRLRDGTNVPFALGASWAGTFDLAYGYYRDRIYHALIIDRPIDISTGGATPSELERLVSWANALP